MLIAPGTVPSSLFHEAVKQKLARGNTDILGINKLKWMGMCEFHSDSHCIFSWGPESHRRNGVAHIINK